MIMLKQMSGHTRKCKFQNDYIWEKMGVVSIEENMIKVRLQWFRYM